jgi:hypothetical protein
MVREIKTELDRLQCDPGSRECQILLFGLVQAMRERLKRHFESEERAWNQHAPAFDASTKRWVHLLSDQHREMEKQIDLVHVQLEQCLGSGESVPPPCDERARALLRDLTTHELSEDRVFQRSIFEELDGL